MEDVVVRKSRSVIDAVRLVNKFRAERGLPKVSRGVPKVPKRAMVTRCRGHDSLWLGLARCQHPDPVRTGRHRTILCRCDLSQTELG